MFIDLFSLRKVNVHHVGLHQLEVRVELDYLVCYGGPSEERPGQSRKEDTLVVGLRSKGVPHVF